MGRVSARRRGTGSASGSRARTRARSTASPRPRRAHAAVGPRGAAAPVPARRHAHARPAPAPVGCAVLTVSDTRSARRDPGGDGIARLIERAGHRVVRRAWTPDDVGAIRAAARAALADRRVDAVIATGGTGMAPRDVTPEALAPLAGRLFPGFGERFRAISQRDVGSAAWLSRAGAGAARGKLLFWLPGSPAGANLAVRELILPGLGHALRLLGRISTKE